MSGSLEVGWFRGHFGWLHRHETSVPPSRIGLVIVPPFGYEALCTHRSLRRLAETAAAAGLTAVRFDLAGTGDSAGHDLEHGRLDAWLGSIADACDIVRAAGADRVVLVGVRLGATLATLAAARRREPGDVAGVVAIAPVPSGKALLREGRALQMALDLPEPPPHVAPPCANDVHELVGFAITNETHAAVSQIDLVKHACTPAPAMLVIDRDDLPSNEAWVAALRALGVETEHLRLPGYVEMVLDPHCAVVPQAIWDATVRFAVARPAPARPARPIADHGLAMMTELPGGIVEEATVIDRMLFAIASRRAGKDVPKRAVILVNSGAIHHVGPNRLYVEVARRLAADGALAIRIDLSGLGDSRTRAGANENTVYGEHATRDIEAVVAWARSRGASHIAVAGLCSGAYHALKAALGDAPIDTVVPINPLTFFWKPDMPLELAAFRVTAEAQRYKQSVKSVDSWKKLMRGDVDLQHVARIVVERARAAAEHRGRDVLRRLRVPLADDLGGELLALGRKGVAMRFVFAASDPGQRVLFEQGGSAVARLERAGALTVTVVEGPDHTFTPRWSHPMFVDAILRAVS